MVAGSDLLCCNAGSIFLSGQICITMGGGRDVRGVVGTGRNGRLSDTSSASGNVESSSSTMVPNGGNR